MGLEVIDEIDAVGIDRETDDVVLLILDSWGWADEREHLAALQGKINAYFSFVESGEIYGPYPTAAGKRMRIDVIGRYTLPPAASAFIERASLAAEELGLVVRHRIN